MPAVEVPRTPAAGEWSTHSGFVLATIGSAVGIGSIWEFTYEVGGNGGGAFVLLHLIVSPSSARHRAHLSSAPPTGLRLVLRFVAPALVVTAAAASILSP